MSFEFTVLSDDRFIEILEAWVGVFNCLCIRLLFERIDA